jgi:hypothetical protein
MAAQQAEVAQPSYGDAQRSGQQTAAWGGQQQQHSRVGHVQLKAVLHIFKDDKTTHYSVA